MVTRSVHSRQSHLDTSILALHFLAKPVSQINVLTSELCDSLRLLSFLTRLTSTYQRAE